MTDKGLYLSLHMKYGHHMAHYQSRKKIKHKLQNKTNHSRPLQNETTHYPEFVKSYIMIQ